MARINNLANFLTDVATAIKTKKGSEASIPASNFDTEILALPSQGTYEQRVLSISANGSQTITPSAGYDAIDELELTIAVPEKQLQTKTYNFTQNTNIALLPDQNYDGFSKVNLGINVTDPEYATNLALSEQILGPVVLPYIPLEYIQSTGTQYIDTNVICNSSNLDGVELTFSDLDGDVEYGFFGVLYRYNIR